MLDTNSLSVAQHVAKREVAKATSESVEVVSNWAEIMERVIAPIRERFWKGSQLTAESYQRLVIVSRDTLAKTRHTFLDEISRPATRTKPKGEAHEFFFVARGAGGPAAHLHYTTTSIRLFLSRRRAELVIDWPGLDFTQHLLERTIERNMADWSGGFAEVDANIVRNAGLLVVWRHLLAQGAITHPEVAIPLGDGLMLGRWFEATSGYDGVQFSLDKDPRPSRSLAANPFFLSSSDQKANPPCRARFLTAVDESLLKVCQMDLRDMLHAFNLAHREDLTNIALATMWRDSKLRRIPGYDEMLPTIKRLSRHLAPMLRSEVAKDCFIRSYDEREAASGPAFAMA